MKKMYFVYCITKDDSKAEKESSIPFLLFVTPYKKLCLQYLNSKTKNFKHKFAVEEENWNGIFFSQFLLIKIRDEFYYCSKTENEYCQLISEADDKVYNIRKIVNDETLINEIKNELFTKHHCFE